jgi:hypothetical protein
METRKYVVWEADPSGSFCTLDALENVEDEFELKRGISREAGFPGDAFFAMDPAYPKDIQLPDNVYNLEGLPVVSTQLKTMIAQREPPETEFLRVAIVNHKGRVASSDYFIVNPFGLVECVDLESSDIEWNEIDRELISSCFGLVLDEERIDFDRLIFRPRYLPTVVLVREDMADELTQAGFTGLRFTPVDEFEL